MLLVLDQFEQWLHAKRGEENTELVAALRQCDGEHVQAVVMVRDDFWMAATRFMRDLEIRSSKARTRAAVDLFDPRHAGKVLAAFGRAFGACRKSRPMPRNRQSFLDQRCRVGPGRQGHFRSAGLFAEMMKGKAWTPPP